MAPSYDGQATMAQSLIGWGTPGVGRGGTAGSGGGSSMGGWPGWRGQFKIIGQVRADDPLQFDGGAASAQPAGFQVSCQQKAESKQSY